MDGFILNIKITVEVDWSFLIFFSKIVELEEELRVVGNNLKSLEVSEEKVCYISYYTNLYLVIKV